MAQEPLTLAGNGTGSTADAARACRILPGDSLWVFGFYAPLRGPWLALELCLAFHGPTVIFGRDLCLVALYPVPRRTLERTPIAARRRLALLYGVGNGI